VTFTGELCYPFTTAMTIASTLAFLLATTAAPPLDSPGARSHWDTLVQPATYVAPGGSFCLHVRSLERDWRAGGHFRLVHGERVVWEHDLPFVLWDAQVLEHGGVVGFGFSDSEDRGTGDLFVVAIFADGQIAWQHTEPNQARTTGMTSRRTYVKPEWCVQVDAGRVLFELDPLDLPDPAGAHLRMLGLMTGKDLGVVTLRCPGDAEQSWWWLAGLELRADPGQLVSVWWGDGARYGVALHDCDRRSDVLATHTLAWWQAAPDDELAGQPRSESLLSHPRLRPMVPGVEALALVSDEDRLQSRIQAFHEQDAWVLRVLDPEALPDEEAPPVVDLEELSSIELKIAASEDAPAGAPPALGWIEAFGFDEHGNVEVISTVDEKLVARTLDRDGVVLHTTILGPFDFEVDYSCEWADGPSGTWFVAVLTDSGATIHRIDIARGTAEALLQLEDGVEALIAFADGGFALLGYTSGVHCFDVQGLPVGPSWGERGNAFECRLLGRSLSGDAITLEESDEGAVQLRVLAQGGREQKILVQPTGSALAAARRADALLQVREGSYWLMENETRFGLLVEYDHGGTALQRLETKLSDGSRFPLGHKSLAVAPDGTFWSANFDVLAAVSSKGEPGPVLGGHFDRPRWNGGGHWTVDREGRLFVKSGDRGAFLFDLEGNSVGHLQIPSTCDDPSGFSVSVDGAGVAWWQLGASSCFARFGTGGRFLGIQYLDREDDTIRFVGIGTERWAYDSREVARVSKDGGILERLTTRPDGAWWRDIQGLAASHDGERLVVADTLRAGGRAEGALLACYDFEAGSAWFFDAARGGTLSIAGDWVLWGTRLIHWPTRTVRSVSCKAGQVIDTRRGPELWVRGSDENGPGRLRRFKVQDPG
jgi:hypothetical protein